MTRRLWTMTLLSVTLIRPTVSLAQSRGAQAPRSSPQPQAGKRAVAPKIEPPLTLRQVIESLLSPRTKSKVDDMVSTRGVQFQGSTAVLDILKEFGASARLLSLIPPPPSPAPPPAPKLAGPLNIGCEPKDCLVVVDAHAGQTVQNRTTVSGLKAGDAVVQVFADGYEPATQKVQLEEGKPFETTFRLKPTELNRQRAASVSMLKALAALGGTDGIAELADIEGDGVVNWTDSAGKMQEWPMTFRKRIGNDLRISFKTREGQCTTSILNQSAKQECKNDLKGAGEKVAAQATSLFLSYQLQDVMQTLMNRSLVASDTSDDRLESPGSRDAYALTLNSAGLPVDLIYKSGETTDVPIEVQYSNYLKIRKGQYPGRVAIGRMNADPVFVFTIMSVRTNVALNKN